eukprot:TRINITY_DN27218_c0_g1_i1.p1 TRINITY_DN27218_c0_g1~~TRINITY_DN27218_c0_g1_i1.p1  ORF type:complete len:133 (+),score=19.65 TRINITY_DN27218_c0_g1_i1:57-455(+)
MAGLHSSEEEVRREGSPQHQRRCCVPTDFRPPQMSSLRSLPLRDLPGVGNHLRCCMNLVLASSVAACIGARFADATDVVDLGSTHAPGLEVVASSAAGAMLFDIGAGEAFQRASSPLKELVTDSLSLFGWET